MGCGITAASSVLTGIESGYINSARDHQCSNTTSIDDHPCRNTTSIDGLLPEDCTTWFALQVTVSVLSGLSFCLCFVIFCVIIAGLSNDNPVIITTVCVFIQFHHLLT